ASGDGAAGDGVYGAVLSLPGLASGIVMATVEGQDYVAPLVSEIPVQVEPAALYLPLLNR
ncbi:MAG TPA: hypothetical protein VNK95_13415, partial [Caldilineaceae bacterium]|nr:hypothetical protein [Caldilineaceae bacterium]